MTLAVYSFRTSADDEHGAARRDVNAVLPTTGHQYVYVSAETERKLENRLNDAIARPFASSSSSNSSSII